LKDKITPLSNEDANQALAQLSPVRYVYKNAPGEAYVGFIAEDVPDLVARKDRKSLSPMDIVAVLTSVTKEQRAEVSKQMTEIAKEKSEIAELREALAKQDERILQMDKANDERMVQMEMALAEMQRNQSSEKQVGVRD
jgi:hypothetical protein